MKKVILYTYSRCSTCIRASKWLDKEGIKYQLMDLVKEPPSIKYINLALKEFSQDKRKIFNTRGNSFKLIDFDICNSSNAEIIQLLRRDGKLIKRPFLVYEGKKIILGFNEAYYSNEFA